jgi:hypothetical protein
MQEGMLWYDSNHKSTVEDRLNQAIDYFITKNGRPPLQCYVNPDLIESPITLSNAIKVVPNERVLKNHFWLEYKSIEKKAKIKPN